MKQTFSSDLRLKNVKNFFLTREHIKRLKQRDLILLYQQNSLAFPRLAIIITKANIRNAVERNRLKRIIKESFRLQQNVIGGHDVVIKCYNGAGKLSNQELRDELNKLWKKIIKL
jgi:ribonuclease P protein component